MNQVTCYLNYSANFTVYRSLRMTAPRNTEGFLPSWLLQKSTLAFMDALSLQTPCSTWPNLSELTLPVQESRSANSLRAKPIHKSIENWSMAAVHSERS